MKKVLLILGALFLTFFAPENVQASTFSDDFNNNNADGWTYRTGNWWVEDGMMREQTNGGVSVALIENKQYSSQTIETDFKVDCDGCNVGFNIWFQSFYNRVEIFAGVNYQGIFIVEFDDLVPTSYFHPVETRFTRGVWYGLRAVVNDTDGDITVYLDDKYLFTQKVITPNRMGSSGLLTGSSLNEGVFFDNFILTYEDTPPSMKDTCKNNGWMEWSMFENQGVCIKYVNENNK